MKEFIEKLIGRLEEELALADKEKERCVKDNPLQFDNAKGYATGISNAIESVNQLAEEYNNDFCEWEYDDFEDGWQTSCGTTFSLCDSDKEITHYCPCCGKKIKVVE